MTRLTYDDASHTEGCTGGKRACVDQRASERASERPRLVVRRASLQPAQAADLCAVMVCLADTRPTSQSAGAKRWGRRARATCSTTPATTASTSSPMPASTSAAGASPPPSEPAVLTHTRDAGGARLAMREPAQPPRKHFCLVLPGAADAALHVCLTLEDSRSTWVWVSWGRCGPFTGPCVCFRCFRGYLYSVYCTLAPVYPVLHPGASFNVGVGILGPLCLFSWLSAQCTARSVYVLHLGAWAATCRRSVLTPCFGPSDRYTRLECLRCHA